MSNIKTYVNFIESKIQEAKNFSKEGKMGMVRSTMKDSVELLLDLIWKTERSGESKKNDYISSTSKSGITLKFQVDRHLYDKNNNMEKLGECKAYLDKSMLKRAYVDFAALNTLFPESKNIIVSLERSTSEEVEIALSKFMNIDIDILYLVEGKRSSSKPMYNKLFFKDLNVDKYNALCKYFLSLYEKNS